MPMLKCIACGKTQESQKQHRCSHCGYPTYPLPYERSALLANECRRFLNDFFHLQISEKNLSYFRMENDENGMPNLIRKSEDQARFPSAYAIEQYVFSAKKSEKAIENAKKSLLHIRSYLSTRYEKDYSVSYEAIDMIIQERDQAFRDALHKIGICAELAALHLPEVMLHYEEEPIDCLLEQALALIDVLDRFADKIGTFIKQYNVYGGFGDAANAKRRETEKIDGSPHVVLQAMTEKVLSFLQTQYRLDIFSDGREELSEMLDVFFQAIHLLLCVPTRKKTDLYVFDGDGISMTGEAFLEMLRTTVRRRYAAYRFAVEPILSADRFSEDALFALYDHFLGLDRFGIFQPTSDRVLLIGENEKKLDRLIGLSCVKESVRKIKAFALANKGSDALNLHMCFYGNPGTGKTEVARLIAGILYENHILPTDHLVEVSRVDLVSPYVGETPQKTMDAIMRAIGGVLFIDEAYSLIPAHGDFDFGHEAIATLIKAMEDYRGQFCVIFAGYRQKMSDMFSVNPGFRSRIQFELEFPNYTRNELGEIASLMLSARGYSASDAAMAKMLDITDIKRRDLYFANAREMRNVLDQVMMCQQLRVANDKNKEIGLADVDRYIKEAQLHLPLKDGGRSSEILTAEEELDALVGLSLVKRTVRKIRAYAKRNQHTDDFNVHMCFCGNPGTGKTEVARILSRILYEAGVIPEAKLIETDAHGLLGNAVGETAPKTEAKIRDALGGVLFIDEAYALAEAPYGKDAIEVLLKQMEDQRGHFCVIFAGYHDEMKNMFASNPGLKSRIQFSLAFPDYTREELSAIFDRFAERLGYVMDVSARSRMLDITEGFRAQPHFANARTVRHILEQAIMNQNLRTEDDENDNRIILADVEDIVDSIR